MAAVHFKENDLNVFYISKFFEKERADAYLSQLKALPFYTPTLQIRGKSLQPKRQILAFGDSQTTYAFSGTQVSAEPWTDLMLEIRQQVEKYAGCSFNFVLLNLYSDGNSYISPHKDAESSLDATFPIVTLSFGEKRTLEFKRRNFEPTTIELEHGSLYSIHKPTNELFTHGIAPDPSVKNMRISLTFRHLIPSISPTLKKAKLQVDPIHCQPSMNPDPEPVDSKSLVQSEPSVKPDQVPDDLDRNDWLVQFYQEIDSPNPRIANWTLNWDAYVQIVMEKDYSIKIHIRNYKELPNGYLMATKKGVMMNSATWSDFERKLIHFNFSSLCDSFIANNQLLMACLDEDYCFLQQMFHASVSNGFFFKLGGIRLSKDQIFKLKEMNFEITEAIIEALLTKSLPYKILNTPPACHQHHLDEDAAKSHVLSCVTREIQYCVDRLFFCEGCSLNHPSEFRHPCIMNTYQEKFIMNRQRVLLNLNVSKIVQSLFETCTCFFNEMFLKQFDMQFYESYFETIFSNHV